MATEALSGAVRSLLPVKTILRDYMNDDESSSEEEAPVPKKSKSKAPPVVQDSDSSSDSSSDEEDNTMLQELKSDMKSIPPAVLEKPAEPLPAPTQAPLVDEFDNIPLSQLIEKAPVTKQPEPVIEPEFIEKKTPVTIEKLDTPPEAPVVHESTHAVISEVKPNEVILQKDPEAPTASTGPEAPVNPNPPQLVIDTEPSVHFTPYDTVFDENKTEISEIRYAPKVSVEDKPPSNWGMSFEDDDDDMPKLSISNNASSLGLDDVVDLDAPPAAASAQTATAPILPDDIDEPLTISGDFEELG
jgi:hypothetical protein